MWKLKKWLSCLKWFSLTALFTFYKRFGKRTFEIRSETLLPNTPRWFTFLPEWQTTLLFTCSISTHLRFLLRGYSVAHTCLANWRECCRAPIDWKRSTCGIPAEQPVARNTDFVTTQRQWTYSNCRQSITRQEAYNSVYFHYRSPKSMRNSENYTIRFW